MSSLTVVLCLSLAFSPASGVGSVSTVAPRPLAMGGAFVAVSDELAAMAWNPAGLNLPECRTGVNLRIHANILGGPAVIRETGLVSGVHTEPYSELPGGEKFAVAVGSVVKGVTMRRGGLAVGLLLLEEYLDPVGLEEAQGLSDPTHLLDTYYSTLTIGFSLAPTVSIGVSQVIFSGWDGSGQRLYGGGRIYGAMLNPNDRVTVGLVYYDVADSFESYRRDIEGLADRTMNAGLTFRPVRNLILAFDLRDLAEKHSDTALEPRIGAEWNLWGRGAIRGGLYREDDGESVVLTLGMGAIPMVACFKGRDALRADSFVLSYAVLLKSGTGPRHLISVLLHF